MRQIAFVITAVVIAAGSAAAAWKEFHQPQLGFSVEFPADPAVSTGSFHTALVPSATAHIYSVKEDHALYVATVVDLLDRKEEGANILNEAEFNLTLLGDVVETTPARVEGGRAAVWGHFVTIGCRSGKAPDQPGQTEAAHAWFKAITEVACPDRGRLTVNMFFNRGRLYLIQGINLPSTADSSFGPSALRFASSVSFFPPEPPR